MTYAMPLQMGATMRISSPYGPRIHPVTGQSHFHNGVDIAAPTGTPVYAVSAGRVVRIDRDGEGKGTLNGNAVLYRESDPEGGLLWAYLHLDTVAVQDGQTLQRGQLLGTIGSTGRSTGPHLHLMVYRSGQTVDPLTILQSFAAQFSPRLS